MSMECQRRVECPRPRRRRNRAPTGPDCNGKKGTMVMEGGVDIHGEWLGCTQAWEWLCSPLGRGCWGSAMGTVGWACGSEGRSCCRGGTGIIDGGDGACWMEVLSLPDCCVVVQGVAARQGVRRRAPWIGLWCFGRSSGLGAAWWRRSLGMGLKATTTWKGLYF